MGETMRQTLQGLVFIGLVLSWPNVAQALNFDWGEVSFSVNNTATLGAAWRLEERDDDLIGKLNLNPDLCPDDCLSFSNTDNPAPNQRLVDAPGGFFASNVDNGNLNYDQGDVIAAQARLASDLTARWGDVVGKISLLGFYDLENTDFRETHPDTIFQPARTDRLGRVEDEVGNDLDILEGFVSFPVNVYDQRFNISVGEQRIRWGEANLIALNSIDELNPPNANRLHFPGLDLADVFEPTGLVVVSTNLTANVSLELVYQYDWEPLEPPASGSFFAFNDVAGGGDYAVIGLGQFSEDPQSIGSFKNDSLDPQSPGAGAISSSSQSVRLEPETFGYPEDGGQYGARLGYFAEWLNGGTELGFYALNYHSRFPYGSVFATDESCFRDAEDLPGEDDLPPELQALLGDIRSGLEGLGAPNPGEFDLDSLAATIACEGFNGSVSPIINPGGVLGEGREPLPIDTLRVFLEYPEDIQLYGISFNTNLGKWSLSGEYAYRPNLPLQVQLADVVFAGVQPAFPEDDVNLVLGTFSSGRNTAPDFVETRFRGNTVQPNQYIPGFERMKVGQVSLTGIRVFSSSNWIAADQIILLVEAGFTHVLDFPDMDELQFDGGGANATHASPGADGTGLGGEPDPSRINPTQQTDGFGEDFAWGYRILATADYNDLLFGFKVTPMVGFFHDVSGVAPAPIQNFIEDRKQVVLGASVLFTPAVKGTLVYESYFDGDDLNLISDRDNVALSLSYSF